MASNIFHKSRTKSNKDNNVHENKLSNLLPVDDIDLNTILNKNSVKSSLSNWLIPKEKRDYSKDPFIPTNIISEETKALRNEIREVANKNERRMRK